MSQKLKFLIAGATSDCVLVLYPGIAKDINPEGKFISDKPFKPIWGAELELTAKLEIEGVANAHIDDLIAYLIQKGNFEIESITVLANPGEVQNPVKEFVLTELNPFKEPVSIPLNAILSTGKTEDGRYFDKHTLNSPIVLTPLTILAIQVSGSEHPIEIIFNEGVAKTVLEEDDDKEKEADKEEDKPVY
ncbi:hypothetical protein SAMN04515674_104271 [Pseudarcicella hirudinis]|uniref:Uncharacterized protein n=1 Tax=Pseudarcicella hirudinis TaxID=1079859 RepID=A0A1I5RWG5_9BACT|nr:hypothetical protein [Pseudarcicella hirudinis]SFP62571.1 hypothetical protein SAMN04515674_104271 [Pseudarcicella hirudinis]